MSRKAQRKMRLPVRSTSPTSITSASASSFSFSLSSRLCACMLRHGTTKLMLLPPASTALPSSSSEVVSTTLVLPYFLPLDPRTSSWWYWSVRKKSFLSRVLRRFRQTPVGCTQDLYHVDMAGLLTNEGLGGEYLLGRHIGSCCARPVTWQGCVQIDASRCREQVREA